MSYKKTWPFSESKDNKTEELSFLQSLAENKVFRTKSDLRKPSHEQVSSLFYLYFLALYALTRSAKTEPEASEYLSRAVALKNFDHFRVGINDYYNMAHMFFGDISYGETDIVTLITKDKTQQQQFIRINKMIASGTDVKGQLMSFTLKFEKMLRINNGVYKDIRRKVLQFDGLDEKEHKVLFKRLAKHIRLLTPRADILPLLKQQVGTIDSMTGKQKAALGLAIAGAGFAAGYNATRSTKK